MPFYSNTEIRTAPEGYVPAQADAQGNVKGPQCCGQKMTDVGGCSEGCCDDYKCASCGYRVRVEWPD